MLRSNRYLRMIVSMLVSELDQGDVRFKPNQLDLDMKHCKSLADKPSIEEAPKVELKALPHHLRYVFFGKCETLPGIITSDFNVEKVECLVLVLKRFK